MVINVYVRTYAHYVKVCAKHPRQYAQPPNMICTNMSAPTSISSCARPGLAASCPITLLAPACWTWIGSGAASTSVWGHSDVVEAHATALNWTGTLLSNHICNKGNTVNSSETFQPWGSLSVAKQFVTEKDHRGQNFSLQFIPLATYYVIAQQRHHLMRTQPLRPHTHVRTYVCTVHKVCTYACTYMQAWDHIHTCVHMYTIWGTYVCTYMQAVCMNY